MHMAPPTLARKRFPTTDGPIAVDQRQHRRTAVAVAAKVRRLNSGRYHAGTLRNVSAGGALLALDDRTFLRPGEAVSFGAAWQGTEVLLSQSRMVDAKVVRGFRHGSQTHVALRFAALLPTAVAA